MVGAGYHASFKGRLDGNGHVLRNGQVNEPGAGERRHFDIWGWVFNLGVENITVTGKKNVGGLIGYNDLGNIISCSQTVPCRVSTAWVVSSASTNPPR